MKTRVLTALLPAVLLLCVPASTWASGLDLTQPGTSPPPKIAAPKGATIAAQSNIVATALTNLRLTPGAIFVLCPLDENGYRTEEETGLTVTPDLADPKGGAVVLDLWDTTDIQSADDPAPHLGQITLKADRNGITLYGARFGANPLLWRTATTLFPKGVTIAAKSKLGVPKKIVAACRTGDGGTLTAPFTCLVGISDDEPPVAGFLWLTGEKSGIGLAVDPTAGLTELWINGQSWEVLKRL